MRELLISITRWTLAAALLCALVVVPARADGSDTKPADAREDQELAELKTWWEGLNPSRREELSRRLKAFKALSPEQQEQARKNLAARRRAFTDELVKNIEKLGRMSFLQRARLHMALFELEMLSRREPAEFKRISALPQKERAKAFSERIVQARQMRFLWAMPKEQREELIRLPQAERRQRVAALARKAWEERTAPLAAAHPRLADVKANAERGDAAAQRELKQIWRDIDTLDMLIESIEPERRADMRKRVAEAIAKAGADGKDAGELLKKELRDFHRRKKTNWPNDRKPESREGGFKDVPKRDGPRGPRNGDRDKDGK